MAPCDPLWLWRSDRRGLGRRGKENGDLRLDKGLALLPVAEFGVEGLHSGAEVRPHYEGDVDRPLRTLGTQRNGPALVVLAGEVDGTECCGRHELGAMHSEPHVDVVHQEEL